MERLNTRDARAVAYVRRIRNERKREYARAYLLHLVDGRDVVRQEGLSLMAAQAVERDLRAILDGNG